LINTLNWWKILVNFSMIKTGLLYPKDAIKYLKLGEKEFVFRKVLQIAEPYEESYKTQKEHNNKKSSCSNYTLT
jgi:hypothetical protein